MGIWLYFSIKPRYFPFALAICLLGNLLKQMTSSCLLPSIYTVFQQQDTWATGGGPISVAFFPHTTFMHHFDSPLVIHFSVVLSVKGCPRPNGEWRELMFLTWNLLFWCIFFNFQLICWKLPSWTIHSFSLPTEWRSSLSYHVQIEQENRQSLKSLQSFSFPDVCQVCAK